MFKRTNIKKINQKAGLSPEGDEEDEDYNPYFNKLTSLDNSSYSIKSDNSKKNQDAKNAKEKSPLFKQSNDIKVVYLGDTINEEKYHTEFKSTEKSQGKTPQKPIENTSKTPQQKANEKTPATTKNENEKAPSVKSTDKSQVGKTPQKPAAETTKTPQPKTNTKTPISYKEEIVIIEKEVVPVKQIEKSQPKDTKTPKTDPPNKTPLQPKGHEKTPSVDKKATPNPKTPIEKKSPENPQSLNKSNVKKPESVPKKVIQVEDEPLFKKTVTVKIAAPKKDDADKKLMGSVAPKDLRKVPSNINKTKSQALSNDKWKVLNSKIKCQEPHKPWECDRGKNDKFIKFFDGKQNFLMRP